jgi:glycosyltransferase involved in cell wall biosynthesis
VLDFCTSVFLVEKPRYREPRWSTIAPPEAEEYESPAMRRLWEARKADLSQVEYTYLARYGGDVLVEHDVTFDLYAQIRERSRTFIAWWNFWRWKRFEMQALKTFRRVVVMSEKDKALLQGAPVAIIENGVDLERFVPEPERAGKNVLFIGSFRHFPNIVAYRFLTEEILPLAPGVTCTVVAGPDPWLHWKQHTGTLQPPEDARVKVHGFVADVRPMYHDANIVVVPTRESAGTNVKVLEAMAMERAVVSTPSGCQGFGLEHGVNVRKEIRMEGDRARATGSVPRAARFTNRDSRRADGRSRGDRQDSSVVARGIAMGTAGISMPSGRDRKNNFRLPRF